MNIELVKCVIEGTELVLFKMDGCFYTTGAVVAHCLGVTPNNVTKMRTLHGAKLRRSLSVNTTHAKVEILTWLARHRAEFMIERLREDMVLYELRDVVRLAFYARSERAADISDAVIELYVSRLAIDMVSREEHQQVLNRLLDLETKFESMASAFGSGLASTRGRKFGSN